MKQHSDKNLKFKAASIDGGNGGGGGGVEPPKEK